MPTTTGCPDVQQYHKLITGELVAVEMETLLLHLEGCATCARQVATVAEQDSLAALVRQSGTLGEGVSDQSVALLIQRLRTRLAGVMPSGNQERTIPPQGAPPVRSFSIRCPACKKPLKVKAEMAGKKAKCPHCQKLLQLPAHLPGGSAPETHPAQGASIASNLGPPVADGQGLAAAEQADEKDRDLLEFLAPPQVADELGRLGPYRVLQILGSGGMGVVYKAEDPQLKRLVALKAMLPGLGSSVAARKRFLREAQSAAAIKHDHIVGIYQVGEDRGAPFLAMEFLQGESLDHRLQRAERLPLAEALRIGREIAEGLEAAHEGGLIHRDIKPANVWLEGKRGRVKILDFGLARAAREEAHLTQSGAIVGTPAYMAPEQAQSKPVDHRCDLFSLGVVLYRLCTGEMPFRGSETISVLVAVSTQEPRPPKEFDGVPDALSELVMQLLEKNPADRPASAGEVVHRLEALEQALLVPAGELPGVTGRAASPVGSPRRDVLWIVATAAALVVLVVGTILLLPTKDGVLRIEIDDPGIEATVGAGGVVIKGVGEKEIKVEPGEKSVRIKRGELDFETDKFILKKGATVTLRIEFLDGKVLVTRDDRPFAEREVPATPKVADNPARIPVVSPRSPSAALEALRRDRIPPEALAAAGGGDPKKAPTNLVAVLGEAGPAHTSSVRQVVFSSDGRWLASASQDRTIILWDGATGRGKHVFSGHTREVSAVAFGKDDLTLLSTSWDGTLKIWPTDKETAPQTVPMGLGDLSSAAVSRDGRFVAVGSKGGAIKLLKWGQWDHPLATATAAGEVSCLAFSPDGETLAAGCSNMQKQQASIRLFRTSDGEARLTLPGHLWGVVFGVAFSRDGKQLASVGGGGKVNIWDPASGKPVDNFDHDFLSQAFSVAFSADGNTLAVGGWYRVRVFRLPAKTLIAGTDVKGTDAHPTLAFSPDGKRLALGDSYGGVFLYETATWAPVKATEERGHRHAVTALAVSPDGRTVLSAGNDGSVRRWDLDRPGENQILHRNASALASKWLEYSPDGRAFAEGVQPAQAGHTEPATIWDPVSGQMRCRLPVAAFRCVFSPDSKSLAGVGFNPGPGIGGDRVVRLWDAEKGTELRTFGTVSGGWQPASWRPAFSSDGRRLAVASDEKQLKVWNVPNGEEVTSWDDAPLGTGTVAFSPDDRTLATGRKDFTIGLWDLSSKAVIATLRGHTMAVTSLRYTPDGKTVVSAARDGTIRVWGPDREHARQVLSFGPLDRVLACELDSSGKYLFVGNNSGLIFVLRLP
jgi:WD40 repeat protein